MSLEEKYEELTLVLTKFVIENEINVKELEQGEIIKYIKENSTNH